MSEQTTWAVHVQGPDDMHACLTREVADALALVLNRQFECHKHPNDPPMKAVVTTWPYGYEGWRAAAEQLRFVALPARTCEAVAAERERCARLCDAEDKRRPLSMVAESLARQIRAGDDPPALA